MANSLGTASLQLTANNSQLSNTLGKTEREVRGWASRVGGFLKNTLAVAGKGAGLALAAGLGAVALVNPFERIQDIAKQGDIAQSLGITVEAFTSIAGVARSAGSDTRDFLEGLVTLSGKAMDAAAGRGEETVRIFQQLGVSAQEFANLDPEKQFYALFEALNKVENPAMRVNLLLKAVGEDTGKNMVSLLGKSTDELRQLGEQFKVTTSDMAKAQVAAQQLTAAKAQLNKALDQVAIALAPVAEMLADRLPAAIEWCKGVILQFGPPVVTVMRYVAQGVAAVVDVWNALKSGVTIVVGGIVKAFGYLVQAVSKVMEWAQDAGEFLGVDIGLGEWSKDARQFAEDMKEIGRMTIDGGLTDLNKFGENQRAALKWFDELMKEREKRVEKQAEKLKPAPWKPQEQTPQVMLVKTALQGTQDANKIIQSWNFGAKLKDDIAKQQLAKQAQANDILKKIQDALSIPAFRFGIL